MDKYKRQLQKYKRSRDHLNKLLQKHNKRENALNYYMESQGDGGGGWSIQAPDASEEGDGGGGWSIQAPDASEDLTRNRRRARRALWDSLTNQIETLKHDVQTRDNQIDDLKRKLAKCKEKLSKK